MYICSECGTKYKIMPKFCDCGNDIFIEETEPQIQNEDFTEEIREPQKRRSGRGKPKTFSPVAIAGFVLCIILALIILFFIGNPEKEIITEDTTEQKEEQVIDIPDIETFWDNTVAKIEQKEEVKEEPEPKPIMDMMPKFVQNILPQEAKKTQTPKVNSTVTPKQTSTQKVQPKTQPKAQTPAIKTTTQTTKPVQTQQTNPQAQAVTNRVKNNIQYNNPVQQTPQQVQPSTPAKTVPQVSTPATVNTNPIKTTPPTTQITPVTTQPSVANNTTTAPSTAQTAPAFVVKTKSQTELTKELNTYKASLRNTIGRKIDFTKVIGDGDCAISFKINSSGKLISKTFTKQSSNITLNDAVFTAMNSLTSYNAPPEGYKGETLNLKIRFYNGNFEITLN